MTQLDVLRFYAPPVLALALLQFAVLCVLGTLRVVGIVQRKYPLGQFKLMKAGEIQFSEQTEAAGRNFINLFEVPVLFYALVPWLVLRGEVDPTMLIVLWVFVGLRYLHSAIHLTVNDVRLRFGVFLLSSLTLMAAWALLAQRVL
jgi:hypothetical protein